MDDEPLRELQDGILGHSEAFTWLQEKTKNYKLGKDLEQHESIHMTQKLIEEGRKIGRSNRFFLKKIADVCDKWDLRLREEEERLEAIQKQQTLAMV